MRVKLSTIGGRADTETGGTGSAARPSLVAMLKDHVGPVRSSFSADLMASIVVFLIAMPLSMGCLLYTSQRRQPPPGHVGKQQQRQDGSNDTRHPLQGAQGRRVSIGRVDHRLGVLRIERRAAIHEGTRSWTPLCHNLSIYRRIWGQMRPFGIRRW